MNDVIKEAQEMQGELVNIRRYLHQNPEVDFDLEKTRAFVTKKLREYGLEPTMTGGGITAELGQSGRTILLRADMDALPVAEDNDLPFKASNGNGHLCGHDMHTAMLLGAAKILKKHERQLRGKVRFMFQPAEESGLGALDMIEHGVLEGVDCAAGLHVTPDMSGSKVEMIKGAVSSSIDAFTVTFLGKGGHSSMPEDTIDPLFCASTVYQILNGLVAREVSMHQQAVFSVGQLGGGEAGNIIPDKAIFSGAVRCFDDKIQQRLVSRVKKVLEHVPTALDVKCEYDLFTTPSLINDTGLCDEMEGYLKEIIGEQNFIISDEPMSGSEDFSEVSRRVPSMFLWLGMGISSDIEKGTNLPLHNPGVIFDETYLYRGSALLSYCALKWMENHCD